MLGYIFKLLCLKDRKNVRLVCRNWYDACNTQTIQSKEKIYIGSLHMDELEPVIRTLFQCRRKCFNFEFCGLDFKRKPRALFWKKCGSRVQTLQLTRCKMSVHAFLCIVKYCSELQTLRLDFNDLNDMQYGVKIDALDSAIASYVTNASLQKLEIRSNSWQSFSHNFYWLRLISQLFRLFPSLITFSLSNNELCRPSQPPNPLLVNVETYAHFQLIYKKFLSTRMENIALNFLCHPNLEWNALASIQGLTK